PISWEVAFRKIADKLNSLHPDEAAFYTSGRTSNEAAFLYQLFVRQYGTNNMPDCSNMCHESSRIALKESIGTGKGSVKLEDFYQAEAILIIGQNPGTNHPRMLSALQKAKEKGAIIISINPLPETGLIGFSDPQSVKGMLGIKARLTDLFLPVRINGDMALLRAIYKLLLESEGKAPGEVFDLDFIKDHTEEYEAFVELIRSLDFNELVKQSGVEESRIRQAAELLRSRKKIIACWAMGLTQHKNSVDTIKEVVNLLLLKGSIGKPGAGTCPVRGHSNVQGDFTMGVQERPSEQLLDKLKSVFGFEPPRNPGYDSVDCVKAMHEGKVKFFFAMGGNFLSAMSDNVSLLTRFNAVILRCKCRPSSTEVI
ncbi:MAG: molybdopterin-dependent oxidoreductase, partial [Flavobacteriales bacterium]